ncbi:MAG: hypothetical protein Q9179_007469, partial [Wetmoreana sp. 5 TL-2023]
MPRVQEQPEHPEGGRKYGAFQTEIYKEGLLDSKLPTVTTDPNRLEEQARTFLGTRSFNYVAGGAGEKATMDANRLAFRQWKVRFPGYAHGRYLLWFTGCTDDPSNAETHYTSGSQGRAKSNGYTVLLITLDTWTLAWRPADLDNAYVPFASGIGDQTGFSDPAFRAKFTKKYPGRTPDDDVFLASREWEAEVFSGAAHTWEDLEL